MLCLKCGKESGSFKFCYSCYLANKSKKNFDSIRKKIEIRDKILVEYCKYFQIDELTLKSRVKKKDIAEKRIFLIYLLYKYANMTMMDIGKFLQRDHTTISYAVEKAKLLTKLDNYKNFMQVIENLLSEYCIEEPKIFYQKYESIYVCEDGHKVKSKIEREIDNYLYRQGIIHSYEPQYKSLDGKVYYPDFYLPNYNLYIEYFGRRDLEYVEKANRKIANYNQDKNINFEYLTYQDDVLLVDRLKNIIDKYTCIHY